MFKNVLFDMGGTLEDIWYNEETQAAATERLLDILHRSGLEPGCEGKKFFETMFARYDAYKKWSERAVREKKPDEIWPDALQDFNFPREKVMAISEDLANVWECTYFHRELRPGVRDVLEGLKKRGFHMGVVSNTSSLYAPFHVLENYGVRDYFDNVTLSSITSYRKPATELFTISMYQMRSKPEECVYVGDTVSRDIIGAKRAGFGLAVQIHSFLTDQKDVGVANCPERPDVKIESFPELLEYLDSHKG